MLSKDKTTICFAHSAYRLRERFMASCPGIRSIEVRDSAGLRSCISEADVLVVSGLWRDALLDSAPRLRFIQSIGAGTNQFPKDELAKRRIRLASASGVNARAVSEHAIALILALSRKLPEARDNQAKRFWREMIGDPRQREDELGGKTLAVVGLGQIGLRLVALGKAFDMNVVGVRRNAAAGGGAADAVFGIGNLHAVLPLADYVVLCCPLTPETENLIDVEALARMKPSARLINVARGKCVDEAALIAALQSGQIAGAALDVTVEEPLAASSELWGMPNVLITPHTAGETSRYEENLIAILLENLDRLWRGETSLRNEIV